MPNIRLISSNLSKHPTCPHGPTLLFSRLENGKRHNYFACSACRDRKDCAFYLSQVKLEKFTQKDQNIWIAKSEKLAANVNHITLFKTYNDMKINSIKERVYCKTCESFQPKKYVNKHENHALIRGICDRHMDFPTEFLTPLNNSRKEAQYFFSAKCVETFVRILEELDYTNVLCIGTPRIHEKIQNDCPKLTSLLLDFDKRFHNFFGPLNFCWYNFFNHHFFKSECKQIFEDFMNSPGKTVLVTDPPFGGRIEPLANSIKKITKLYPEGEMDIFWFFPYFMEAQMKNSFPSMKMMDYKVDYDNHALFNGDEQHSKAKFGSPVRIFTNVNLSKILLPTEEGYKYCKRCDKYVAMENRHCRLCKACTSKDGRRYRHCARCGRCVKPAWQHCDKCDRCALPQHQCHQIAFLQDCFHCNESGHKKNDCPELLNDSTNADKEDLNKGGKRKVVVGDKIKLQINDDNIVKKKFKCK